MLSLCPVNIEPGSSTTDVDISSLDPNEVVCLQFDRPGVALLWVDAGRLVPAGAAHTWIAWPAWEWYPVGFAVDTKVMTINPAHRMGAAVLRVCRVGREAARLRIVGQPRRATVSP